MKKFQRLGPFINQDGIVCVGQRMAEWIKQSWNQREFFLLPRKGRFTELVVRSVHCEDHAGLEVTLAKIRRRYWIPCVRKIIKRIKDNCVICRKRDKVTIQQQMGVLPSYRLNLSPPFYNCAIDIFGPFTIRDTVKKRTHGKAYGVLINCLNCRGVYIDLAEGYDTGSFIVVFRRFVSIRGNPKRIISDAGTQLVAAGKELKKFDVEWNVIKSADAPWENGCSESLIKSVKRCLQIAVGDSILTFLELQSVLFEVANLINERPIRTKVCEPNEGTYLYPNDLLLGRSSVRVPQMQMGERCNPRLRWKFIQQVVDTFWRRWIRDYFPTLIVRQKWHTSRRNLERGDLVLVQDTNMIRGKWKLAQVTEAEPGKDGKVRDVTVQYKNIGPGAKYVGCTGTLVRRSVHRLVVILPIEECNKIWSC